MRKFTSLMLMLLCAVTTWGQVSLPQITEDTNNPIYYTIYNTRSGSSNRDRQFGQGGLIYFAGDAVGLKDAVDEITSLGDAYKFYFTGSYDELYVHNAATSNKLASVSSWTAEGTAWCVIQRNDGNLAFGPKGATKDADKWWNEKNYTTNESESDFTNFNAEDAGSGFVVEPVENYKFPESDKFYTIECPLFEKVQGIKKGLYVDTDGSIKWNTIDLTNKNFYWVPTVGNGTVVLKNIGTGKYLSNGTMSDTEVTSVITPLGSNQFGIKANNYVIHADGHREGEEPSGSLADWANNANTPSAWCFVEQQDPDAIQTATVTYSFVFNSVEKYTQEKKIIVGEEYPEITVSIPYGITATKPEGTVASTETKVIELSVNKELPFVTASDAASISNWYYVRMHTNQPGFIGDIAEDNTINVANGKVGTSADSKDNYLWGFVGNVFDGIKVVNKGTGKALTTTGSNNVTLTENGTSLFITETTAPGNLNATDGFCLRNPNSANYINANHTAGKLAHWSATDAGSTFMIIEPTESLDVEITAAGYATYYWNLPAYIPEGVQAFVVNELNGTYAIMNEITGTIPANTGVVLKGDADAYSFAVAHYVTEETATAVNGNKLKGSVASKDITPAENTTYYVLANGDEGVGLYPDALSEGIFRNNANKAYLPVVVETEANAPASYSFNFDWAGTTGIEGVTAEGAQDGKIYDITGRRVKAITAPGIYIVNGRKVVK